jgi:hypothetical protein
MKARGKMLRISAGVSPGLDQQHFALRVFGKARGNYGARRPATDHYDVRLLHGHSPRRFVAPEPFPAFAR